MAQKIIVIGGGIAGLSAGCYARMNGFETELFEAGHQAGGVCVSWERSGYSVNGSIHWLVGSSPGTDFYDLWMELGVIEDTAFYRHSLFVEYENVFGQDVHFYTNVEKLEAHLLEIAPEDEAPIRELTEAIRTFASSEFPMNKARELFTLWDWTKVIAGNFSLMMAFGKYARISVGEFAERFQSPVLREVFGHFWDPDMSLAFLLLQWASAHNGAAGYPLGGSGAFIGKMEARYRELGGTLHFHQRVSRILIENDRAVGIVTEDGREHRADYVISACDGNTTLSTLLEGKYTDEKTKASYASLKPFPGVFFLSMGVQRTFEEIPPSISGLNLPLIKPITIGNTRYERNNFLIYNFDPTLAPEGKTLITAMFHTDYDYWKNLYDNDPEGYGAERKRIIDAIVASLDQRFPGLADQLDFTDAATPVTYENETGNYRGSYEGWLPTPGAFPTELRSHLPGLSHFYLAGHWTSPGGGMPPAARSGRDAIQLICHEEKQHFETSIG